jgi:uncharacterized protein (TIGR04255 family)
MSPHPADAAQMAVQYKRPPITEAVIEIRFEPLTDRKIIDRVKSRFEQKYPFATEGQSIEVAVTETGAKSTVGFDSYKLLAADGCDLILLKANGLTTVRQPPYEGWEKLFDQARENWAVLYRILGYRRIDRIGVRYVNRIDVPDDGQVVDISKYLQFSPQVPPSLGAEPMVGYAVNVVAPLGKDKLKLILNSSSVPSPLVKTASFVLDIDISREVDLPQKDEDIWALIDRIREYKNSMFEALITDEARALFSR